jgi:hypothetical protein
VGHPGLSLVAGSVEQQPGVTAAPDRSSRLRAQNCCFARRGVTTNSPEVRDCDD